MATPEEARARIRSVLEHLDGLKNPDINDDRMLMVPSEGGGTFLGITLREMRQAMQETPK